MSDTTENIIKDTANNMAKAITHFEGEVLKIRAGKATPTMLDGLTVEYYGSPTPISQVANISVIDARTITIQPWEKTCWHRLKDLSWLVILVLHHKMMVSSSNYFYHH